MGVIEEGILRGCQGLFTPVSLGITISFQIKNLLSSPFLEIELFGKLDLGSILEIGTLSNRQDRGILRTACS